MYHSMLKNLLLNDKNFGSITVPRNVVAGVLKDHEALAASVATKRQEFDQELQDARDDISSIRLDYVAEIHHLKWGVVLLSFLNFALAVGLFMQLYYCRL